MNMKSTLHAGVPALPEALKSDPGVVAYLNELAADIAAHGGFQDREPVTVIAEAHARRQEFAKEILNNETERAAMAREVLLGTVYGGLVAQAAADHAIQRCENMAEASFRRRLFSDE